MTATAVLATNGQLTTPYGKTAHGLIRGSSRYTIVGVVDVAAAGRDAGEALDGTHRNIPVHATLRDLLSILPEKPRYYILGYAVPGGAIPPEARAGIVEALEAGISVVSGMHRYLIDDSELCALATRHGAELIDVRKPRGEKHFWSGAVLNVKAPRIAVLGTDCAIGKRTTARLITELCNANGLRTEFIGTGQTGWMQGARFGFILDSTLNDFVGGEIEHAIVSAASETNPELIVLEGQSALRHPAGPCGAEFIVSGGARGVILQHAPAREFFSGFDKLGLRIPPIVEEIQLIRLLGAETLAITLNTAGLTPERLAVERARLGNETGLPVALPLEEGLDMLLPILRDYAAR